MHGLSKTAFLAGRQCPKRLWCETRVPEQVPAPDDTRRAIIEQGLEVGALARRLYPGGVDVSRAGTVGEMLRLTRDLLAQRRVIFEGVFSAAGGHARADILAPEGEGWTLIEVKSATRPDEVHLHDIAFQWHVLRSAGVPLRRACLAHVNSDYVRRGPVDPAGLFTIVDLTNEIEPLAAEIPDALAALQALLAGDQPEVPIGPQCGKPYACPLIPACWSYLPEDNVTELYRRNGFDLLAEGYARIVDVPEERLNANQRIQQAVLRTGRPHIEAGPLRAWLDALEYPVHMLDFETASSAIPLFDGTRPYQQIPFQFSVHVLDRRGAEPRHHEFLWTEDSDPRPALVEALRVIGPRGSVMAYFAGFERARIDELAEAFPEAADFLEGLNRRLVDLIDPFTRFWVHHPAQHGSCSIKKVLPALTGSGYQDLAITRGDQAAREWLKAVRGGEGAEAIFRALREYCALDTRGMVDILAYLQVGRQPAPKDC
jgi:hypothetical protein